MKNEDYDPVFPKKRAHYFKDPQKMYFVEFVWRGQWVVFQFQGYTIFVDFYQQKKLRCRKKLF